MKTKDRVKTMFVKADIAWYLQGMRERPKWLY